MYSEENGPQLGATIQRAKNMHAVYDSRITLKLFYAKEPVTKRTSYSKSVVFEKQLFVLSFFFALHPANFYKFAIFWHF